MSWKEKMKDWGGGDIAFLSEDGEAVTFIVVGEPILLEGKYKGKVSEKIGCPCVTADGYTLFVMGKRLARKISKYEDKFDDVAFTAIRHGEANDIACTYEIKLIDDLELLSDLQARYNEDEVATQIEDSVKAALEVMNG